ncbi:MAG: hypothetical protein AB8G96_07345 [Phycisphaerales bacterium]
MNQWNDPNVGTAASELLAQRALIGLDADEARELETLLGVAGATADDALSMDRLAARLHQAIEPDLFAAGDEPVGEIPPMPAGLRESLTADASRFAVAAPASTEAAADPAERADAFDPDRTTTLETAPIAGRVAGGHPGAATPAPAIASPNVSANRPVGFATSPPVSSRGVLATLMPWLGWTAAAAVLAFVVLTPRTAPITTPTASVQELVAAASDRIDVPLNGVEGIADAARGRVVWSGELQRGYLVLSGLAANDPSDVQYQLWMFDADRTARNETFNAVDGGVFDIPAGADEVIIEIDAKLDVFRPELFAITSEPPGGVVKHNAELDPDRYRIVAVAPVPAPTP